MLVLVPYVLSHGEVSVADAAHEFGLTPAEVERLFGTLSLVGSAGDGSPWAMPQDMFDIDWDALENEHILRITNAVALERAPKLSAREAAALVAGLQLVQALPGVGDSEVFTGLREKLARAARSAPADVIVAPAPVDEVRVLVASAVAERRAIRFTYKTPDGPTMSRTVDPVKVHLAGTQWYLQGWCHVRQAMRTFHLDRVSDVSLTDLAATHSDDPAPALFSGLSGDVIATIRYPTALARVVGEYLDRAEIIVDDDRAEARFGIADAAGLRRLAARAGGELEVLDPPPARSAVAQWAVAALELYGEQRSAS